MSERTKIAWCDSTARVLRSGKWPGHPEPFETWTKDGPRYRVKGFAELLRRMNARPWVCNKCGLARTGLVKYGKCVRCDDECAKFHRRRVFIGDSCDLLDPAWPAEWLAETLWQMSLAPEVVQILCTKRPELFSERMLAALNSAGGKWGTGVCEFIQGWKCGARVPQNVCVLASVENPEMAAERIPALLRIPARWHGLSCEPLLGPIWLPPVVGLDFRRKMPEAMPLSDGRGIDWLIIGGESGPNARPCNVEWVRSLVAQGKTVGMATFVKQLGANVQTPNCTCGRSQDTNCPDCAGKMMLKHPKGGDPSEWPHDLQRQQWPEGL